MGLLIVDTSVWIDYFRGEDYLDVDIALKEGRVYLPPLVVAELMSGTLTKKQASRLLDFLNELPICDTTREHWYKVGTLRAILKRKGISISTPDAHVAQCCLDIDGRLISRDKIFKRIGSIVGLQML